MTTINNAQPFTLWTSSFHSTQALRTDAWKDLIEFANNEFDKMIEWRVEYESSHDDAGSAYAHLTWEDHTPKAYADAFAPLAPEDIKATPEEWRAVWKRIKDFDLVEMRSGHIFSSTPDDAFLLERWGVGEVEEQCEIDADDLQPIVDFARLTLPNLPTDNSAIIKAILRDSACDAHYHGDEDVFYLYACTDAVWSAIVWHDTIRDTLSELREES